ncbi:MAG TPA: preprotein translocase subunit SecG [Myxococcaceae bacterium]|nr:preprotein translocase subunit SecG [Myxococcaceae bacterium]
MLTFITIIHVLLCVFMMFVILLQPGKDAGMGAALGGGAATSAFGGRGAVTFLSKLTAVCAALFFLTSLGLSFVGMKSSVAAGVVVPSKKVPRAVSDGGTAPAETGAQDEAVPGEPEDATMADEAEQAQPATEKPASSDAKKAPAAAPAAAPTPKRSPTPKKP